MKNLKFRRIARGVFKYSLLITVVVSAVKLFEYTEEQHKINVKHEKRRQIVLSALAVLGTVAGVFVAAWAGLKEVRRRRGGYLFDLFDRDNYDVVGADEEDKYSDIIKGELNREDDGSTVRRIRTEHVPVDDETTADNL